MTRFRDGRGWTYHDDLIIAEYEDRPARTRGEPATMRQMHADFGEDIKRAADLTGIDAPTIMAVIALESVTIKGSLHRDPNSYRWEARINDYSAGLMQLLSSTARQMVAKYELGVPVIDHETLCIPSVNIIIGATYLMHVGKRHKTADGVLLQAAFNAGGVYYSTKNEWRLRTHAPDRTYRYMQWHNDAVEVLRDH